MMRKRKKKQGEGGQCPICSLFHALSLYHRVSSDHRSLYEFPSWGDSIS